MFIVCISKIIIHSLDCKKQPSKSELMCLWMCGGHGDAKSAICTSIEFVSIGIHLEQRA